MRCFVLFAMSVICVSQVALSAGEMVPFNLKGSHVYPSFTLSTPVPFDAGCNGPAIPLTGTSHGNVTHLGKFSESADVTFCLNGDPPGSAPGSSYGTATWTAANGDEIFLHFTGQDRPQGEGEDFVIADYELTIDGGNGRFAGASGTVFTEQIRPDTGGAFNTILPGSYMSSVGSVRSAHAVPEPASLSLVLGAVWGFGALVRRRTRGH